MINFPFSSPPYVIPTVRVAFRYRMMVFTASVFCRERFLANRLTTDVAKAMSGLVSIIENINDPIMPWYCSCSALLASSHSFEKNIPSFIGVLHSLAKARWDFFRNLSIWAGYERFSVFFWRSLSIFKPRPKLMGQISIISKTEASSRFTFLM